MNEEAVLQRIETIVRDVLDSDSVKLTRSTVAEQVPDWDSLAQVQIIVAVEKEFRIRFDVDELGSFENVGALVDAVMRHAADR